MTSTEPLIFGERLEPCADELITSLRGFGYDPAKALADLVDNSISANARTVRVEYNSDPGKAWVAIVDDGGGLEGQALRDAMRFAHNSGGERGLGDLGRFGLGLKTASLSQARRVTVMSRGPSGKPSARTWDVDHVARHREWLVLPGVDPELLEVAELLGFTGQGTMVLWRALDRIGEGPLLSRALAVAGRELALIFHRFLQADRLTLEVSGKRLDPRDPYLRGHPATQDRGAEELRHQGHRIQVSAVVLPHPDLLSQKQRQRTIGPGGLTGGQGFYVYRGDRLVVAGDWLGLEGMTRSVRTRLARVSVDIPQELDAAWEVDVMKSSVRPPDVLSGRLRDLAEDVRIRSERVFSHRGTPASRPVSEHGAQPVWTQLLRRGGTRYTVNREHPLVAMALAGEEGALVEQVLRLVGESVPVSLIMQGATTERTETLGPSDQDIEADQVVTTLRGLLSVLPADPIARGALLEGLAVAEPFHRHPRLFEEITGFGTVEE